MTLLASVTTAGSLLGLPVEIYYYGTMFVYCGMLQTISSYWNKFSFKSSDWIKYLDHVN
jgi:hypothetical protein